jgi:hypothetical protein
MTGDDPDNDFITHHSDDEKARDFRKRIMKGERFARTFKKMLPYFDSMGILDEM